MLLFVPQAGPPVLLLLGPLLLFDLLLAAPFAALITLMLAAVVAAGVLVALVGLLASPYLLVRHVRTRRAARRERPPVARRRLSAGSTVGDAGRRAGRWGWLPAPAAGVRQARASFVPRAH